MLLWSFAAGAVEPPALETELDRRVWAFLEHRQERWHDMNVPAQDGRLLYDLITTNGYTRALEIGTSTGRSGIWIAWALSKTGGSLITIDIDEHRRAQALENFTEAGLSELIDARLADAHTLVPTLEGPFDFVFCDADKLWYPKYFDAVLPKLVLGGCFTAHNVKSRMSGIAEFLEHLERTKGVETSIQGSWSGVSVSYKRQK